jgi:aminoglycoside phosphotransferase (APT) family kinase protein
MGPRDPVVQAVAVIDWRTGKALSDQQQETLGKIKAACADLLAALHYADGTQPDAERFGSRPMAIAATQIELGVEMAYRAVLQQ